MKVDNGFVQMDENGNVVTISRDLTLREYYAGLAMQGELSGRNAEEYFTAQQIAEWAVQTADALITELNKGAKN